MMPVFSIISSFLYIFIFHIVALHPVYHYITPSPTNDPLEVVNFWCVDPDPHVGFSLSLSRRNQHVIGYIIIYQGRTLWWPYELRHFIQCMITDHSMTLHWLWWSLHSLNARDVNCCVCYWYRTVHCKRWLIDRHVLLFRLALKCDAPQ